MASFSEARRASLATFKVSGTLAGDLLGELESLGAQLVRRKDEIDEADLLRLGRLDHVAGEDHPHRVTHADEPRQALGAAAAGDQAEVDLRLAETGLVGGDPHVARHRELAAAAETEAVDHRDHRLRE